MAVLMIELLVLLTWMGIGVTVQMVAGGDERHVAWIAAGSLLGPLWWVVIADRQMAARSPIEVPAGPVRPALRGRGRVG